MDRLLKRIQRVRQAEFCCRDIFLLHDNTLAHKAASVCQFLTPQKSCNPLSLPVLSRFISARLFSVPQVENEVKRTPLRGCCWNPRSRNWWIKESPTRGIFDSLSEIVRLRKSLYICQWSLFWIKKTYVSSSRVFDLKKITPKTSWSHFVCKYQVVWKSIQWEPNCYIRTDRQTWRS